MRKSFVALALLVGAATMLTTLAFAQDSRDEGVKVMNARMAQQQMLTKAARLGTSAASDTMWVGHSSTMPYSQPYHVGVGPYRPGVGGSYNGMWDFDTYDGGAIDSMQGWIPVITPNTRSAGTIADELRPWQCLDWGNRMNASPIQGRTPGIISAWHSDNGNFPLNPSESSDNDWTPLAGSRSAWCGLRGGNDFSVVDLIANGGTGNHINGEAVIGVFSDGTYDTNKNFPGYGNQWDQLLYRDVRVASGASVGISFLYETQMDSRSNTAAASCKGWFDRDPLNMQQGGFGFGKDNFISASAYLPAGTRSGPVDSFMVYVGVPTNPTACQYTDGLDTRPVYDLKRRWFSEVIAIDKPYKELLSTFGKDSVYRSSPLSFTLDAQLVTDMLEGQGNGGGVIRFVFRTKTNANYSDETNTGGSYVSTNKGAVRIDQVAIAGATPAFTTSGFEAASDINNTIEGANSASPGPAVGVGYALGAWHATGKSPKLMAHTHPLAGGLVGPGNNYNPLAWADLCGPLDSPIRICNMHSVIISTGDHDANEAVGGPIGTPFKENRNGLVSPAINLVVTGGSSGTTPNDCGIDGVHKYTDADWWIYYDMYSGVFSPTAQGNVWGNSILSYPVVQRNHATIWGDLGYITGVWTNSDKQCFLMSDVLKPLIFTSTEDGVPDSVKLYIFREQRCISWAVTTGCSPNTGHYIDNVALCLPPPSGAGGGGGGEKITVDIWDWYTDAFPVNEAVVPGSASSFDTCGAFIQNGRNNAPNTGDALRFDVPGDSIYLKGTNTLGDPLRMDCVFRVYPGPGNYVIPGNKTSGVRKVTAAPVPVAATASDRTNFWGEYMAKPGYFSKGTHAGNVWNVDTWNSVRIDTAEVNMFPNDIRQVNLPGIQENFWMSTIYDPKAGESTVDAADLTARYTNLGISKNRCFLIDNASNAPLDASNITCSTVPTWVTALAPGDGYNGQQTTKEYTKIFPDGLLTAGSSVQYFFRQSYLATPASFVMTPDTNRISPQPTGSAWNYDGVRWEGFSILPDRWKDITYNPTGLGSACMLVIDYNDRRGDERSWVGLADSIGATAINKYGAHNGWHCDANYIAPGDGSHNYSNETDCGTNANIAVWKNGGHPGTTWDLYDVKAAESSNTGTAQIGGRLISSVGMGLLDGKQSRQGPSPDMLRTFYRMLFIMTGDLNNDHFGKSTNRGQKDVELVQDFLTSGADENDPRGIWIMGHGFVESIYNNYWYGPDDGSNYDFILLNMAVDLDAASYLSKTAVSAIDNPFPDLLPTAVVNSGAVYGIQNLCTYTLDVLWLNTDVDGATPSSNYENVNPVNEPYISGVYGPSNTAHPYVSLMDGFDMLNLFSAGGGNTVGRLSYFMDALVNVFGSICPFTPAPTVDVTSPSANDVKINFLGNVGNNPLVAGGSAIVHFGLAKPDRVEVKVYDVTGRLVRTLADRTFQAGPQKLTWDGTNSQGQVVSRGVYFTQVKFVNSGFVGAKKVTVLK
jgi:hypothetical protein